MKRRFLIIIAVILVFIGGYFVLNEFKKNHLVNEAQEKAEKYVMENYEDVERRKGCSPIFKLKF